MIERLTRRAVFSFISRGAALVFGSTAAPAQKAPTIKSLPRVGEFTRFLDGITETPVVRLTTLESSSYLPARENRAVSLKGRFLVFSSDRAGVMSPYRLDLRTGQVLGLASTQKLDRDSLALDAAGRLLFFLEDRFLKQLNLNSKKVQTLVENVSHFSLGASSQDILYLRDGQLLRTSTNQTALAQNIRWCQLRPAGDGCLFIQKDDEGELLCFLPFSDKAQALTLAAGPLSSPCWSPDGRSALFLRDGSLCEVPLDSRTEHRIGTGSQLAAFSSNADGTVFVGAIQSKAQPTINLLLRNPPREFTLCEHRSSRPEQCAPVFSADSRRVYFNSDFQGKPAIYSVNVEGLIEETSG